MGPCIGRARENVARGKNLVYEWPRKIGSADSGTDLCIVEAPRDSINKRRRGSRRAVEWGDWAGGRAAQPGLARTTRK
jgi:hypothetical protein